MKIDEKILQEELTTLKSDFDKTKKQVEDVEKNLIGARNNLNALFGAIQQTERLLKLSKEKKNEKV
jgi:outer membrane protein TolC